MSVAAPEVPREIVRTTAGKVLRSDDLVAGERDAAASLLRANPTFGNPHVVRCNWCRETRTLFLDENEPPFQRVEHGWRCAACEETASSQEIRF